MRADDGARLFLDGALVIDGWRDQAPTTYTATRTVTAGAHEVKIEYYERTGDAVIQASWAPDGGGGDTIRVFITAPASGATVRGTVWFTVWIENAAAGSKTYTLDVNGTMITSTPTTSNGPVSLAWSTSPADNGPRTATVSVRDSATATGRASVTVNVAN